jgi:hypothetical protein
MAVIENTVEIERTPDVVFDYLVDLRNELKWNPDVQSMEKITEGPIGVGTQFRAKWKQSGLLIVECTKFDRPRSWTYRNGGPVSVDLDATVSPAGAGSRVVTRFDAHPHGWFSLVFPVFLLIMRRAEKRNGLSYKRALETFGGRHPDRRDVDPESAAFDDGHGVRS